MEILVSWGAVILSAITALISANIQKKINRKSNTDQALMVLLRGELKRNHDEYIKERSISRDEYSDYASMYEIYHNMGGNGLGTKLYEDVNKLDIKEV